MHSTIRCVTQEHAMADDTPAPPGPGKSVWDTFFPGETPEALAARVRGESSRRVAERARRDGVDDVESES